MFYLFLISISILIGILCIFGYLIITNKKTSKKFWMILSAILILALTILAHCIEPKSTNDLYRHFRDIRIMKNKGIDSITTYDNFIVIKLLFYFVTFLPSPHFLPSIAAIITYGILLYIINDFYNYKNADSRTMACAILFNFSLCSFYATISGIRNAMACAFLGMAIYLDLIKNKKFIIKIWPYIIALLIHPISYLIIGIRLLFNIKWIGKVKYLILIIGIIYRPLINLLYLINIDITNYLADKMSIYLVAESIEDIRWISVIIVLWIATYILIEFIIRKFKDVEFKKYLNFVQIYILSIIALAFIAQIFIKRLTFLLAFITIPLLYLIAKNMQKKHKIIIYGFIIFYFCGLIPFGVVEIRGNTGFVFQGQNTIKEYSEENNTRNIENENYSKI